MQRAESRTHPSTGFHLSSPSGAVDSATFPHSSTGITKQGSSAELWCPEILLGFSHIDVAAHVADF